MNIEDVLLLVGCLSISDIMYELYPLDVAWSNDQKSLICINNPDIS
jgi:hypothetical protein